MNKTIFVFLQIRGSIPLFWHQYPNLKLKPKLSIIPIENHVEACLKHIKEITEDYGDVVMINLVSYSIIEPGNTKFSAES